MMTGRFVKCAGDCRHRIDRQKETPGEVVEGGVTFFYCGFCWAALISRQMMGMGKGFQKTTKGGDP